MARKIIRLVRPDTMEAEAVHRLLVIAKEADAPVMVVHLTNRKAYEEILRARRKWADCIMQKPVRSILLLDDSAIFKTGFRRC